MTGAYVPDRGDVVWLDFDPQAGHEQAGHQAALVLSTAAYNAKSGLMLCCPVAIQVNSYPLEVPITPASGKVTGVALIDQVRCLDWRARNASKFASATRQCTLDVSAKVKLLPP